MEQEKKSPQKKSVPYMEILKQAGRIVWENRFLFWFGLLMALGSPGSFNIRGNNNDLASKGEVAKNFLEAHWQIVLALALVFIAIGIILFLVSLMAQAGLIKSVNLIAQNKEASFKIGWGSGKKYWKKLLGMFFLFFLATFIVIVVLAVPVIYLVIAKSWVGAILVGILAFAIFIPLMFVFALTKIFAEFYLILSDLRVRSAIEAGYNLLIKNIGHSFIFGLLLLAVSIAAGIVLIPVVGIALLILIPAGILFYYLNKIVFAIFLTFAIILFIAVVLFVAAIFQTYKLTAWTLFFQEIARVEKPETVEVAETETAELKKEIAATPEKA